MFFDERIQAECGKIYQKGILWATLTALLYAVMRAIPLALAGNFSLYFFTTELCIVVSGAVILLLGAIKFFGTKDERIEAEKHNFYFSAGKIFLIAALAGYAFAIPFASERPKNDVPVNYLLYMMEILGGLYFFYSFKSREISFNYTFIERENRGYYKHVFVNIGKLSGVLAFPFGFAMMLDLMLHKSFASFLAIILAYISSVLGLGFYYFLLSWVEKRSYEDESSCLIDKGAFVLCILTLVVYLLHSVVRILYAAIGKLISISSIGAYTAAISYLNQFFDYLMTVMVVALLSYMMTKAGGKLFKKAVGLKALMCALIVILNFVYTFIYQILNMQASMNSELYATVIRIHNVISGYFMIASIIASFLLIYELISKAKVSGFMILLPILNMYWKIIFTWTQTYGMFHFSFTIVGCIVTLIYDVGFYLFLKKRDRGLQAVEKLS